MAAEAEAAREARAKVRLLRRLQYKGHQTIDRAMPRGLKLI
jgi:hypothetical protein